MFLYEKCVNQGLYKEMYRIDEVLFSKPSIVIEFSDYDMLINNAMEDGEPFPYDLSDEEFENEVKHSLEALPCPIN